VRAAEADAPIADSELDSLLADIADESIVALAVSGGADSLALLDCIARWHARHGRPDAIVLTVDHCLRPESASEAATVARIAQQRGLQARVLTWEGPRPASDVEAAAREARYRLLLGATKAVGARHLLLAHHRDDQAETFLMRLTRGSGLFGLAAMRPSVQAGEITIRRPFLDLPRSRLAATTARAGLVPFEDPMNRDPRFLRARIRRLMPLFAAEGLDPVTLSGVAARLRSAADAVEAAASAAIARHVTVDPCAVAGVDRAFLAEPEEVRRRGLVRIVLAIGGEPYPPRSERVAALDRAMEMHGRGRFKRTLGGAVVERRGPRFMIYREIGRQGLETVTLVPGRQTVWDRRFRIAAEEALPAGMTVGALGEEGRQAIGARAGTVPAGALAALPAIRRGTAILAVPSIGYGNTSLPLMLDSVVGRRIAEPARFPDLSGD
jgi:tRNA(Ile)-lysidine synthase